MDINNEFIPVETSTTTKTSITSTTSRSITTSVTLEGTSAATSDDYPAGKKREKIITGLTEIEKDILILSISALCLVLIALLWTICIKWRKSKRQRIREFQTLAEGSSQSLFNSSKMD